MKQYLILLLAISSISFAKVTGGVEHQMPNWFKDGFLEITEDIAEAQKESKHVMLFFHMNYCPYCDRMVKDLIRNKFFVNKYFDVIAINTKGDKEIAINELEVLSEKEFANKLDVQYTPTIVFLNKDNKIVARGNGYRGQKRFRLMLDFVRNKNYVTNNFTNYYAALNGESVYDFKDNKNFQNITDFSKIQKPLAIIFEDKFCSACDYFHNITLNNELVKKQFDKYRIVRLDAKSNKIIITPSKKKQSVKDFVADLQITYRPAVVLFDKKIEIKRIDGFLYTWHFSEMLRFVADGFYKKFENFGKYLDFRQQELSGQGIDINIAN